MDKLSEILCCFSSEVQGHSNHVDQAFDGMIDPPEKDVLAAKDIVDTLLSTDLDRDALKLAFKDQFGAFSLKSKLAELVLKRLALEFQRKDPSSFGQTLKNAFDKAKAAFMEEFGDTIEFVRKHPVEILCIILAIAILWLLMPYILEALGFAEGGIITETFAAWWQARYAGYVPKGSLFSFLQRLGMVWKH